MDLRRLARRIRVLVRRDAVERSMADEIRHHLDCETEELVRHGLPPEEARRQARLAFGGLEGVKEDARDARGTRLVQDLGADLRYGWRGLRRSPGLTVASILTLSLGIGIATTMFSAVYGVLLRPLPYAEADRLVAVWERDVVHGHDQNVVSLDNFEAWRARARTIDAWAALMPVSVTVADHGAPERVIGADISPEYFKLLGVAPALGRDFEHADAHDGRVVLLSDAYWKRRYGGDPAIVGHAMRVSGQPCQIVGVMPASFDPPRFGWLGGQALWFPMVDSPEKRSWGRFLLVVGRLRGATSAAQAQAEMRAIAAQRERETPDDVGWSASVVPLKEQMTDDARVTLLVLLGAASLLLVIAVSNVAMLTASAMRRRGAELAIRRAMGATGGRLVRQLLVQSGLLAACGAAGGLVVAMAGVRLLIVLLPPETPRLTSIRMDTPVLAVSTALAAVAALVCGSFAASRGRAAEGVSLAARASEEMRGTRRPASGVLVAVEIAFALTLGVMAVLMARSLIRLRAVDLGFAAPRATVARIALPSTSYPTDAARRVFFDRLVERVRALPGVTAAGLVSTRPLGGLAPATTVRAADARSPHDATPNGGVVADVRWADGPAFSALGIPLITGRVFTADDGAAPPRVVITRDLAERFWPHRSAVGRKLTVEMYGTLSADVIGVVGSLHLMDARTPARPAVFLSAARFPNSVWDVVVRTGAGAEPDGIVSSLRAVAKALDPSLPLYGIRTLTDLLDETLGSDRFAAFMLLTFASAALALAAVGVFGVFAAEVGRRRKEISVRLALGATGGRIMTLLVAHAVRRAAVGIAAGTVIALFAARAMNALLFGIAPDDPASLSLVIALVLGVALVATVVPVARALQRSPLSALREE